jgi:hypothetical protein
VSGSFLVHNIDFIVTNAFVFDCGFAEPSPAEEFAEARQEQRERRPTQVQQTPPVPGRRRCIY